tara:strand:- start:44222 stop:44446 length:225 start_codon:yes stop_codon:yes gene_type:complete
MTAQDDQGNEIKTGDVVGFKSDIEQGGLVTRISQGNGYGGKELTLKALGDCGFSGDYIGGQETTTVLASECWAD